jgi:hypothetical protein
MLSLPTDRDHPSEIATPREYDQWKGACQYLFSLLLEVCALVDQAREQQIAEYLDWVIEPSRTRRDIRSDLEITEAVEPHVLSIWQLLDDRNVVGLGVAEKLSHGEPTGEVAFTIYVKRKMPVQLLQESELAPDVVQLLDGTVAPTDVVELGEVFLQASTSSSVKAGVSIQARGGPGTVAGVVSRDSRRFLLTNRHVLAPKGAIGPIPVRSPADVAVVGEVAEIHMLKSGVDFLNEVDAGLVAIDAARSGDILLTAPYANAALSPAATIGMKVSKLGAKSGVTDSEVLDAHFAVRLDYPGIGLVGFRNQIRSRVFADGGDSGSMVWESTTGAVVGLHFAGTSDSSLANPIQAVLGGLRVGLESGS